MTDSIAPFRSGFRIAAMVCSLASAALTLVFGLNQSNDFLIYTACAAFLVACSFASDYVWLAVKDAWRKRSYGELGWLVPGAVFVLSLNLISNLGSVGWQRDTQITKAALQQIAHDDGRGDVANKQKEIAALEKRIDDLKAGNPWVTTISADSERARIPAIEEAIRQEERRGGCGPRCLKLKTDRDALNARIATAEAMDKHSKDLAEARLALTVTKSKAHENKIEPAAPASQAGYFASLFQRTLEPTQDAKVWTDRGLATWISFGLVIAPILFSLIGFDGRNRRGESEIAALARDIAAPAPAKPIILRETITHKDPAWQRLCDNLQSKGLIPA